jgi:hypothetical protein
VAVDLDDRVVDIEERVPRLVAVDGGGWAQQLGEPRQRDQESDATASS